VLSYQTYSDIGALSTMGVLGVPLSKSVNF